MSDKKTLVVLYPGCVEFEIILAAQFLNGTYPVEAASPDGGPVAGASGLSIRAQKSYGQLNPEDYRAVLIPGGDPGSVIKNDTLLQFLSQADDQGVILGAICAGPVLLAAVGLLRGRKYTYGYGEEELKVVGPFFEGGHFSKDPVVTAGNIITSHPQGYVEFAVEVARNSGAIEDEERAEGLLAYYRPNGEW